MRIAIPLMMAVLLGTSAAARAAEMPQVPMPEPRPTAAEAPVAAPVQNSQGEKTPESVAKPQVIACDIVGAFFSKAEQPQAKAPDGSDSACVIDNPVTLDAILALDGARRISITGTPLLSCAYVGELTAFLRTIADPMAEGTFGAAIREVRTGPGFQCRYRNRASSGKVSAHGKGIALDIAGFELTDGRFVAVGSGPACPCDSLPRDRREGLDWQSQPRRAQPTTRRHRPHT